MGYLPVLDAITRLVLSGFENMGPVISRQSSKKSSTVLKEVLYYPSPGNHDSLVCDVEPESMDLWVNFQGLQCIPVIPNISEKLS